MNNKICSHILLYGLLSSANIIFGMGKDQQIIPSDDTSVHGHHHGLAHTIDCILDHEEKYQQPQHLLDDPSSHNVQQKKKDKEHSKKVSGGNMLPLTPIPSPSQSRSTSPVHSHHHHYHVAQKLEKIEDEIHKGGDVVLNQIMHHPQKVREALSPFVGPQNAQVATEVIEEGASLAKTGADIVHNLIHDVEANHHKQHAEKQQPAHQNNSNGLGQEPEASKLPADSASQVLTPQSSSLVEQQQKSHQITPPALSPQQSGAAPGVLSQASDQQGSLKRIETEVIGVGTELKKVVTDHPTIAAEALALAIGQGNAGHVEDEVKEYTPEIEKEVQDLTQNNNLQTPVVQTPVVQTPVVQTPVVQTPVVQTPVVQTPVVQTPVVQTPVVQTPVVQTPVVQTPVVQTPVVQTPVVQTSVDQTKIKGGSSNKKIGDGASSGPSRYTMMIGGTAVVITLAALIAILHKFNRLPDAIAQILNKIMRSSVVA